MTELETLPNIGPVLAACLRQAGINSAEELRSLGERRAFEKLRATMPEDACLSKLYAIAGAIEGVRWHSLSFERRAELATLASAL